MFRTGVTVVFAALLLIPAAASAQDSRRERIERERGSAPNELVNVLTTRRARLGVNVDLQAEDTDSIGARIEGVTPGGPADKAGLRAGDVITKLDGETLLARNGSARRGRSIPGLRLIELAAQLEPGDTVAVEYQRDGQRRTASIVTESDPNSFVFRTEPNVRVYRELMEPLRMSVGENGFNALWFSGSRLGGLELAPMNADLGQYFGVNEGVLVINAPDDSELQLRGGDVVLSVDGREPSNPQHLLRILRSYEPGESVRLEVQRNRRRETITARLDEAGTRPKARVNE